MADEGFGLRKVLDKACGTDYVEVMFAKNLDEAKSCCNLLEDVGIIAQYDADSGEPSDRGIAIKVPEERFIEASELLAARVQQDSVDDEVDEIVKDDDEVEETEDEDLDEDEEEEEEEEDDADDDFDDDDDDDDDLEEASGY